MPESERNEPEKLLKVKDVADLLGIHEQTVYDMARSGELPALKVRSEWRFRPSDVVTFQSKGAA